MNDYKSWISSEELEKIYSSTNEKTEEQKDIEELERLSNSDFFDEQIYEEHKILIEEPGEEKERKFQIKQRSFCYNCQIDWDIKEIDFSLDGSEHCPDCGDDLTVPPVDNPWEIWP